MHGRGRWPGWVAWENPSLALHAHGRHGRHQLLEDGLGRHELPTDPRFSRPTRATAKQLRKVALTASWAPMRRLRTQSLMEILVSCRRAIIVDAIIDPEETPGSV